MIGHERMRTLRSMGQIEHVKLLVGDAKPYESRLHVNDQGRMGLLASKQPVIDPEYPEVITQETEPLALDLRWLAGLRVHVIALDNSTQEFFHRWLQAVVSHEPRHLFVLTHDLELVTWPE